MRKLLACLVALVATAGANAAPINSPVPTNAYITMGGLDWAWANPLPGGVDLSYQGQFGWRLPTAAELANSPFATDFLTANGNVPFNGIDPISGANMQFVNSVYTNAQSRSALAVPYFSLSFLHADWGNGRGQPTGPWAGMPGSFSFAEQLVVRNASPVPEPISMIVFGSLVVGGIVAVRRRMSKAAA